MRLGGGVAAFLASAPKSEGSEAEQPNLAESGLESEKNPAAAGGDFGVWLTPNAQVAGFNVETLPAAATDLSKDSKVAVGVDSTVHVVDPEHGRLLRLHLAEDNVNVTTAEQQIAGLTANSDLQITAVGDTAIIWDPQAATFFLSDGRKITPDPTKVSGEGFQLALQQPSAAASYFSYTTTNELVLQPLDGGDPKVIAPTIPGGAPSEAAVVSGCVYAAWSGTGIVVRTCPDIDGVSDINQQASDFDANGGRLVWRINRDRVALNQILSGGVWLITDNLVRVDNWDKVIPKDEDSDKKEEDKTDSEKDARPDRSKANKPPVAKDDIFGVRAGKSTVLRVLENDTDEDGDLLTATIVGNPPDTLGSIRAIYDDTIFQIQVPDDAKDGSSVTFQYTVSDGRGGTSAPANVTLTVYGEQVNNPPVPLHNTPVKMGRKSQATWNVLGDWIDPEGDDLVLRSAQSVDNSGTVDSRPEGSITYHDLGTKTGMKTVKFVVSDGQADTEGELFFNVLPRENQPPLLNNDIAKGVIDTDIVISPLANDSDPDGDLMRITAVDFENGAKDSSVTINLDSTNGKITVRGTAPKSVYLEYTVTDSLSQAKAQIRVDIVEQASEDVVPVAVSDTAYLPQGGETLVGVLQNDINPLAGPLVITAVKLPVGEQRVSLALLEHNTIRVSERRKIDKPITFNYTISNSKGEAEGLVTVVPVTAPEKPKTPVAVDDEVVVREGDIANVPVLANDSHPDGLLLQLVPELVSVPDPDTEALVFSSQKQMRVHARIPGTYTTKYQVTDGRTEPVTAKLRISVKARDDANNASPNAKSIEARTVAGQQVRIPIPLDGLDPDGDYVSLRGLGSQPPRLGDVSETGSDYLIYTPDKNVVGVDTFEYVITDRLGAEAAGTIQVAVVPDPLENNPPIAVDDAVIVKPGRQVAIAAALNDTDPENDPVHLVTDSATSEDFAVHTQGDRVIFQAPTQTGDYAVHYEVADTSDARAVGVISVKVAADAPQRKPIARDDAASLEQVYENGQFVTLSLLDNDEDPDGSITEAKLWIDPDSQAKILADGQVQIPVKPELQIIDYNVTDVDGLVGSAFIFVPGLSSAVPILKPGVKPAEVEYGKSVALALSEYVLVGQGKTPIITQNEKVSARNGSAVVDNQSQVTFTADGEKGQNAGAVNLEVADGALNDANTQTSAIRIPITILPPPGGWNEPPSIRGERFQVAMGESVDVDLAAKATDSDVDDQRKLSFALEQFTPVSGLNVDLQGSKLQVSASKDVAPGAVVVVPVSVTDGHPDTNPKPQANFSFTVISTRLAPPKAVDDFEDKANAGQSVCVNVLANDVVAKGAGQLRVLSVDKPSTGSAELGCGGVNVTAPTDYSGQITARYTIGDDFSDADPSRRDDGMITVTVRSKPDPPVGVAAKSPGSQTAEVSWNPPGYNGGTPVTSYRVSINPSGKSKDCGNVSICTIDGLTNNVEYTFSVTAVNEVGESVPSTASNSVRPDQIPEIPKAPKLEYKPSSKGGTLHVSWTAPKVNGSPIDKYELNVNDGSAPIPITSGTSKELTGLTNGQEYKVRVRACNQAEESCKSDDQFSDWSLPESPAGVPDAPGTPSAKRLDPVGSKARAEVCWETPKDDHGDKVTEYAVSGGGVPNKEKLSGNCVTYELDASTSDYTFKVRAKNKAGWSEWSGATSGFRAYIELNDIKISNLSAKDEDRQTSVSFNVPSNIDNKGVKASEIEYCWSISPDAKSDSFGNNTSGTIAGLKNGTEYEVKVWAVPTLDGHGCKNDGGYASDKESKGGIKPYGKPLKPTVSAAAEGAQQVKLCWNKPGTNGRPISKIVVKIDGNASDKTDSGCQTVGNGYSQSHSIEAYVKDSEGQDSEHASANATSNPKPSPDIYNISTSGMSISFDYRSITGSISVRCWNTDTYENRKWPGPGQSGTPNFAGEALTNFNFSDSGHVNAKCPGGEGNYSLGTPFSIEIQGVLWKRVR